MFLSAWQMQIQCPLPFSSNFGLHLLLPHLLALSSAAKLWIINKMYNHLLERFLQAVKATCWGQK